MSQKTEKQSNKPCFLTPNPARWPAANSVRGGWPSLLRSLTRLSRRWQPQGRQGSGANVLGPARGGRHIIVTSGPTSELIDPVRFIFNRSSGRQGHAIAQAAIGAGANVTLSLARSGYPIQSAPTLFTSIRRSKCAKPSKVLSRRRVHRRGRGGRLARREHRRPEDQKGRQRKFDPSPY